MGLRGRRRPVALSAQGPVNVDDHGQTCPCPRRHPRLPRPLRSQLEGQAGSASAQLGGKGLTQPQLVAALPTQPTPEPAGDKDTLKATGERLSGARQSFPGRAGRLAALGASFGPLGISTGPCRQVHQLPGGNRRFRGRIWLCPTASAGDDCPPVRLARGPAY